jgi:hypothetical protein
MESIVTGIFAMYAMWAVAGFLSPVITAFLILYVLADMRGGGSNRQLGAKAALALVATVAIQLALLGGASAVALRLSNVKDGAVMVRNGIGLAIGGGLGTVLALLCSRFVPPSPGAPIVRQAHAVNLAISGLACVALLAISGVLAANGEKFEGAAVAAGIYLAFMVILLVWGSRESKSTA